MYAGAYYDIYIYIQKGTPPGPTKYMSRNLCYTRHKVNDLISLCFFLVEIFFCLIFFWFRVRSFGEEGGGANIYIYMYIYFFPPQTVNNINPF